MKATLGSPTLPLPTWKIFWLFMADLSHWVILALRRATISGSAQQHLEEQELAATLAALLIVTPEYMPLSRAFLRLRSPSVYSVEWDPSRVNGIRCTKGENAVATSLAEAENTMGMALFYHCHAHKCQ
jgi:hypothetical protein